MIAWDIRPTRRRTTMELMKNVQAWTDGVEVDYQALNQIRHIAGLPIVAGHVAIMPDVHLGKGATVGSVIVSRLVV